MAYLYRWGQSQDKKDLHRVSVISWSDIGESEETRHMNNTEDEQDSTQQNEGSSSVEANPPSVAIIEARSGRPVQRYQYTGRNYEA